MTAPGTLQARREARTRAAVATVPPTSYGTAACSTYRAIFDMADSGRAPIPVRTAAAAICAKCPLAASCGFRVPMPKVSSRAKARSLSRNRAT